MLLRFSFVEQSPKTGELREKLKTELFDAINESPLNNTPEMLEVLREVYKTVLMNSRVLVEDDLKDLDLEKEFRHIMMERLCSGLRELDETVPIPPDGKKDMPSLNMEKGRSRF